MACERPRALWLVLPALLRGRDEGRASFFSPRQVPGTLPWRQNIALKKPIGVAEWETKILEKLPENLKGSLPTVQELEAELSRE
jgi:hypothetical protein